MHTTMANEIIEKNWKKFLKCKECWEFKELNLDNWYKHSQWFMWVLWRCKECIKRWRGTEHELAMARIRDRNRYYSDDGKRKLWQKKWYKEYIKRDYVSKKRYDYNKKRNKEMWYKNIHLRTYRLIKKLWIRPHICPICNQQKKVVAHHPDYTKENEIVFCCDECHFKIHSWKIECPTPLTLLPF